MTRRPTRLTLALAALAAFASAHPMGNFSVSHYARIEVQGSGVAKVTYVLDLAELPTYELLQKWDLKQDSPFVQIEAKAANEAKGWVANLKFRVDGKPVSARILDTKIVMASGAGNLPIARITSHLEVPLASAGALDYEDGNYPDRAGWKEIVIGAAKGATLIEASQIDVERSKALTVYPTDPTIAPPQDLRARLEWKMNAVAISQAAAKPAIVGIEQPKKVEVASPPAPVPLEVGQRPTAPAPGEVVKGDALSQLLSKGDLGTSAIIIGLITAFWFGCIHATSPGHGKTMVAAYLVGERGTPKHAIFLGAMVTFTHTVSVFALGVATYFLAGRFAPESVTRFLSILSGLSIIAVGLWLLYRRSMKLMATAAAPAVRPHTHHHDHDHDHVHHHHDHGHVHDHQRAHVHAHAHGPVLQLVVPHKHEHGHTHDHGGHSHTHDHPHHDHHHDDAHDHDHDHHHGPGGHSHVPEGPVTIGSLIALGASGGMVPCPSALVLLLGSVSVGRIGFGLALLTSFSLGLASVLMAIGLAVLYAKHLLPKTEKTMKHPLVKLIPVLSAGAVTVIGVAMTAIAFGWIKVAGV